jgi:hypothetical protein
MTIYKVVKWLEAMEESPERDQAIDYMRVLMRTMGVRDNEQRVILTMSVNEYKKKDEKLFNRTRDKCYQKFGKR